MVKQKESQRVYVETVKKWARENGMPVAGGTAILSLLFLFLTATGAIEVTGHSGDQICAGNLTDPCYAYLNLTAKRDIFIYPVGYDPYGRETMFDFSEGVSDWRLERTWGSGWKEYNLKKTCTGTWCGAPNNKGVKYSFVLRKDRDYQLRVVAYKENPEKDIKWGAFDGLVDPIWFGQFETKKEFEKKKICKNVTKTVQEFTTVLNTSTYECNDTVSFSKDEWLCIGTNKSSGKKENLFSTKKYIFANNTHVIMNTSDVVPSWPLKQVEECQDSKVGTIKVNQSGGAKEYLCDWSEFGECEFNKEKGVLECDSKLDGNADGECKPGESCLRINFNNTEYMLDKHDITRSLKNQDLPNCAVIP